MTTEERKRKREAFENEHRRPEQLEDSKAFDDGVPPQDQAPPHKAQPAWSMPAVTLRVLGAASAKILVELSMHPEETIQALKLRVAHETGFCVREQQLLHNGQVLPRQGTLEEALPGASTSSNVVELQLVRMTVPRLHLFKPCSAPELAERYGDFLSLQFGAGYGEESLYDVAANHLAMDSAPEHARRVADMLRSALGKASQKVLFCDLNGCSDADPVLGGEVVVISSPSEDPKEACLLALEVLNHNDGWEDSDNWVLAKVEGRDWNLHVKDKELANVWEDEEDEEGKEDQEYGEGKEDKECKECKDGEEGEEDKEGKEEGEGKDGEEGKADNSLEARIQAGTKIMAEHLTKHFCFEFDECVVERSAVIKGGYTNDGNIVGILTGSRMPL